MIEHDGIITKVSDDAGVAYLAPAGLNDQFIFSYNKIVGYSGQSATELGLRIGRPVNFVVESDVIRSVKLL